MTLALMVEAYGALAVPLYYLGDFEAARQYVKRGVEIWRSGGVQSEVDEITGTRPSVVCSLRPYWIGISGRSPPVKPTMAKAISVAKELNDMQH